MLGNPSRQKVEKKILLSVDPSRQKIKNLRKILRQADLCRQKIQEKFYVGQTLVGKKFKKNHMLGKPQQAQQKSYIGQTPIGEN